MRRRAFLATAGTVLTAGCGALTGGNGGEEESNGPGWHEEGIGVDGTVGEERIDSPDIGIEGDISGPDIDESEIGVNNSEFEEREIGAHYSDDDGTATPENQKATKHIAEARKKLIEAHDEYTSQATGRNAQVTGIKPTTESFAWIRVRSAVEDAMDALERGAEYAEGGQALNVIALEHVGYFLLLSAKADGKLVDAYDHFDFAVARLFNESYAQAEIARRRMQTDWQKARDIFRELESKIEPGSMEVFSLLSERQYDRKIRQLDSSIAAFAEFGEALKGMQNGLERAEPGVEAYLGDEYERARDEFMRASAEFSMASTSLTLVPRATGLRSEARDLLASVKTMEQTCGDLRRSSQGKLDGDRLIYFEAERSAKEHIESDDRVKEISFFRRIAY